MRWNCLTARAIISSKVLVGAQRLLYTVTTRVLSIQSSTMYIACVPPFCSSSSLFLISSDKYYINDDNLRCAEKYLPFLYI